MSFIFRYYVRPTVTTNYSLCFTWFVISTHVNKAPEALGALGAVEVCTMSSL